LKSSIFFGLKGGSSDADPEMMNLFRKKEEKKSDFEIEDEDEEESNTRPFDPLADLFCRR
jgi:hypothetical protein